METLRTRRFHRGMRNEIMVIGGTGKTGRRVSAKLAAQGVNVRAVSRNTPIPFDWTNEATWAPAIRGVDSAYITYSPDLAVPGAAETVEAFSALAVKNGVRKLVLLSGRGEAGALRGEEAVRDSGAEWTVVRAGWFNQNFSEDFLLDLVLAGEIVLPAGHVAEPFIDVEDIVDVAVAALTGSEHAGEVYEVTGPRLLTFEDIATELTRAIGRTITYIPVQDAEYRKAMIGYGVPQEVIEMLSHLFVEVLDGRNAYLTNGVERALGRAPRDFADYARDTAATGVWSPR